MSISDLSETPPNEIKIFLLNLLPTTFLLLNSGLLLKPIGKYL